MTDTKLVATAWTSAGDTSPVHVPATSPVPITERVAAVAAAGYCGLGLIADDLAVVRDSIGFAGLRSLLADHGLHHIEIELLERWWIPRDASWSRWRAPTPWCGWNCRADARSHRYSRAPSPPTPSQAANGTVFVANELGGTVSAVRGDDIVKVFTDSVQPAGLAPVGNAMGLIDVRKNDLTIYDSDALTIVGVAPAGEGPTHLVADRHGRMIATDTRGDAIRVFDTQPRQIAEIAQAGGPYGITYDPTRDRLWVASSGTNEVIGYDMADPTPREFQRIPTVQNPYTVGVDATTGRLFIAGVTAGVVQIVDPG